METILFSQSMSLTFGLWPSACAGPALRYGASINWYWPARCVPLPSAVRQSLARARRATYARARATYACHLNFAEAGRNTHPQTPGDRAHAGMCPKLIPGDAPSFPMPALHMCHAALLANAPKLRCLTNDSKATVSVLYWYGNYLKLTEHVSDFWTLA